MQQNDANGENSIAPEEIKEGDRLQLSSRSEEARGVFEVEYAAERMVWLDNGDRMFFEKDGTWTYEAIPCQVTLLDSEPPETLPWFDILNKDSHTRAGDRDV